MATVELRFGALPEHVRTARLVTAAFARRVGVEESLLDEVRLAVGEACLRAVRLHRAGGLDEPVLVVLDETSGRFSIEVRDGVSATSANGDPARELGAREGEFSGDDPHGDEMGLAIISGLVDDVDVRVGADGGVIRMSWALPAKKQHKP
jgi:anti-sigma regulatory factor (Ser/Thr protein kinase)